MAEIINLRQARKVKKRAEAEKQAAANRRKFGRTKAEKSVEVLEQDLASRQIDGAKRENRDQETD